MRFITGSVFLIFFSCIYSPEKELFSEVALPSGENISVELNHASDTIYVARPTQFFFTVDGLSNASSILGAEVLLDGKELDFDVTDHSIRFNIYPYGDEIKNLLLELKIYAKTGSTSLADRFDSEAYIIGVTRVIQMDNTDPPIVTPSSVKYEEGILTVRWDRSIKRNFHSYTLNVQYLNKLGDPLHKKVLKYPADTTHLLFRDVNYAGGAVKYWLDVNGFKTRKVGDTVLFQDDPIDFEFQIKAGQDVTFQWNTLKNYNHSIVVNISTNGFEKTYPNLFAVTEEFGFRVPFGSYFPLQLKLVPTSGEYMSLTYEETHEVFLGDQCDKFFNAHYDHVHGELYLTSPERMGGGFYVYKYDFENLQKKDSLWVELKTDPTLLMSENGDHFYLIDYQAKNLYKVDRIDMEIAEIVNVEEIVGYPTNDYAYLPTISNNNKLSISLSHQFDIHHPQISFLIDLNTNQIELRDSTNRFHLSTDGQFVLHNNDVLKHSTDNWEKIKSISGVSYPNQPTLFISKENQEYLYLFFLNDVKLYKWEKDISGDSEFTFLHYIIEDSIQHGAVFDFQSNSIVSQNNNNLNLYDFETMEKMSSLDVSSSAFSFFFNDTFFSSNGFFLKKEK